MKTVIVGKTIKDTNRKIKYVNCNNIHLWSLYRFQTLFQQNNQTQAECIPCSRFGTKIVPQYSLKNIVHIFLLVSLKTISSAKSFLIRMNDTLLRKRNIQRKHFLRTDKFFYCLKKNCP